MINSSHDLANVSFSRDELLVLNAALNEICNGVDVFEFETRIGADREFVTTLLHEIGSVLDSMDHLSS
jgi:hypothetical protein